MVYSFIANSTLTEDIVIDSVPDTAAAEEGGHVALLDEELVPLEGVRVEGSPVGQRLKGFPDAAPEAQFGGLPAHGRYGPEQDLQHTEGGQAPAEDCKKKQIQLVRPGE